MKIPQVGADGQTDRRFSKFCETRVETKLWFTEVGMCLSNRKYSAAVATVCFGVIDVLN